MKTDKYAIIVNDDPDQLDFIGDLLKELGLNTLPFLDAESALKEMAVLVASSVNAESDVENPISVVITDLYMPELDGWHFCRLLRSPEYKSLNSIPIIVATETYAGDEPENIARELGVETLLTIPVNRCKFKSVIKDVLNGFNCKNSRKVLVVEDCKTTSALLVKTFEKSGYYVLKAYEFSKAVEVLKEHCFDIAVIDYHLPDKNGDEFLELLKAQQPDCASVMITANTDPELAVKWMKSGAAAYLRKPFSPEYLIQMCEKAHRERSLLRAERLLEQRTDKLLESQRKLRTVLNQLEAINKHSPVNMIMLDKDYHVVRTIGESFSEDVNAESCVGKSPGNTISCLNSINDKGGCGFGEVCKRCLLRKSVLETFDDHKSRRQEVWVPRGTPKQNDNTMVCYKIVTAFLNHDGEDMVLVSLQDHTKAKEQEEKLRIRSLVMDQVQDTVVMTDLSGTILYVNDAEVKALKRSKEELIGQSIEVFGEDIENSYSQAEILKKTLENGSWRGEVVNFDKNGNPFTLDCRTNLVHDTYGYPVALVGLSTDITERIELEEKLRQSQKIEAVGRLAGGVAHDFNNMLGVIIGYTDMLLCSLDENNGFRKWLLEIEKAAKRSAKLTQQLLAFARKQTIAPTIMDLNITVDSTIEMLKRLIGENVNLRWKPTKDLWKVKMDSTQIDQVLTNLCVNARDAIKGSDGVITIEALNTVISEDWAGKYPDYEAGEYVLLVVSDNGCGMSSGVQQMLFEPFFTTKDIGQGTGLGLATVYGIVKQNGGFIVVYSEPDIGTAFKIYLPRVEDITQPEENRTSSEKVPVGNETVLVVEDEQPILALTSLMLKRLGYNVIQANSPEIALQITSQADFYADILLTDVVMPGMNGKALYEKLIAEYPDLKCIYMSGYTSDTIVHHGVLESKMSFLPKPFSIEDLACIVRSVLDK